MLNQDTVNKLSVLGIDVSKLTEAIKAEDEVSLEVPTLYTEDQKTSFGKNRFDEGKTAMSEILAKDVKKTFNIEVDSKDINEVVKAFGEKKVSELGKPNEKIATLESEKQDLQNKLQALSSEKQTLESDFNKKLFGIEVKSQLTSLIPENTTIAKEDVATLFLNNYSVDKDEQGRTVIKKDGKVEQDNVLNPLDLNTVVNTFLDTKGLVKKSGMGGKSTTGGGSAKFENMAEYMEYCQNNDIEPMGQEGQAMLSENKSENFKY
jgi:hypothetical protein